MAHGPQKNESLEILMIIGALTGLCLLIAGAVADLSLRMAADISEIETNEDLTR